MYKLVRKWGVERATEYSFDRFYPTKESEFDDIEDDPHAMMFALGQSSSYFTPDFQDVVVHDIVTSHLLEQFQSRAELEKFNYWYSGVKSYVAKKLLELDSPYLESGSRFWATKAPEVIKSLQVIQSFLTSLRHVEESLDMAFMESFLARLKDKDTE